MYNLTAIIAVDSATKYLYNRIVNKSTQEVNTMEIFILGAVIIAAIATVDYKGKKKVKD